MNEERQQQFLATHCTFAEEGYPATYVLEALDGEELAQFRAHLATCPICTAEVVTLGATAAQLPLLIDETVPESQPSPELRQRLLDAIAAERVPAQASVAPAPVLRFPSARRLPQAYAVAAVLLLALSLGLLAWNLTIQGDLRQVRSERDQAQTALAETRFQLAATAGQTASGEIVYLAGRQQAFIVVNGLPALAPGQVYQLWLIQEGKPQPSTVFLTATTAVQANLSQFQVAAITIEPGPLGSVAPTTTPIVTGTLH